MTEHPKIAVAMSGGVDSSAAALLLKKQGYDIIGVNLNLWSCFKGAKAKTCCSPEDRLDAQRVCKALDIPFVSIDMREEFKKKIILNFVQEYFKGRTPNPCIRCNTLIKFEAMFSWIRRELGIEQIATGHYARIKKDPDGVHLLKGVDPGKDQTYFLYEIKRELLAHIHFPLGGYKKEDVRKIAKEGGLLVAEKNDSQEVCFIPDGDVASFIEDYYPDCARGQGNFVDEFGKVIGQHRGIHAYTIGQRRGLGKGFGDRRYVTAIKTETNEIVLGDDQDLQKTDLIVEDLNFLEDVGNPFDAEVKIRYKTEPVPAQITLQGKNAMVEFKRPVRAVTPGQSAVFYNGDVVIGGGWII